jgi:hypothetical protein
VICCGRALISGGNEGKLARCSVAARNCQFDYQFAGPAGSLAGSDFTGEQLKEVRAIRLRDLSSCSQCAYGGSCTRCPGLAFLEGNMRGPSTQDCEKSFARTGIPSANLLSKKEKAFPARLVQIQLVPAITGGRLSAIGSSVTAIAS